VPAAESWFGGVAPVVAGIVCGVVCGLGWVMGAWTAGKTGALLSSAVALM